jgi:hypothetical protein
MIMRSSVLQLIPDDLNEDVAQVMMFYRWRRAPILQLLCTLRRQACEGDFIVFASDDGMPLVAMVRLGPSEKDPSATQLVLNVEYQLPKVLVEFAGKLDVHMHVNSILQQNLEVPSNCLPVVGIMHEPCCSLWAQCPLHPTLALYVHYQRKVADSSRGGCFPE